MTLSATRIPHDPKIPTQQENCNNIVVQESTRSRNVNINRPQGQRPARTLAKNHPQKPKTHAHITTPTNQITYPITNHSAGQIMGKNNVCAFKENSRVGNNNPISYEPSLCYQRCSRTGPKKLALEAFEPSINQTCALHGRSIAVASAFGSIHEFVKVHIFEHWHLCYFVRP